MWILHTFPSSDLKALSCLSVLHFCTTREMEAGNSQHLLIQQNSAIVGTIQVVSIDIDDRFILVWNIWKYSEQF